MAPIRLQYKGMPLQSAALRGNNVARDTPASYEWRDLDDAFDVLMSSSDVAYGDARFNFGPPCLWLHTLESAKLMANAIYRSFLPDWHGCFREQRKRIPYHVPERFAPHMVNVVAKWIIYPSAFSWDEHNELYCLIQDGVCPDGYLANDFADTPDMIVAYCYGSLYPIDIENCQPDADAMLHEYNPQGIMLRV